jgi:hypothetical protein
MGSSRMGRTCSGRNQQLAETLSVPDERISTRTLPAGASDWPVDLGWTTYDKTLSVVRDDMKFLNADDKAWILGKTAQQVWPFA